MIAKLKQLFAKPVPPVTSCQSCEIRLQQLARMQRITADAVKLQGITDRRIHALMQAFPEIHEAYFTRAGEKARERQGQKG
jgi:hypothetical protein